MRYKAIPAPIHGVWIIKEYPSIHFSLEIRVAMLRNWLSNNKNNWIVSAGMRGGGKSHRSIYKWHRDGFWGITWLVLAVDRIEGIEFCNIAGDYWQSRGRQILLVNNDVVYHRSPLFSKLPGMLYRFGTRALSKIHSELHIPWSGNGFKNWNKEEW